MLYHIYTTGPTSDRHITSRRSDAALYAAEQLAYDLVKAQAGLDTTWGEKAMQAVRDLDPSRGGTVTIRDYVLFFTCDRSGARS